MARLRIGLTDNDRTRPVATGQVPIAGADAEFEVMAVQALFNRQLTGHTFDICEFPIATYLRTLEMPGRPYVALPVFTSRHFRLSCVFVAKNKGIEGPADLAGRKIGIPVFDMAAAVWLRGIFQDHFGLERTAPVYVIGGLEAPRQGDEHPQFYPPQFRFEERGDAGLAELLARGEIDALYTARAPGTWPSGSVGRLFEQPMEAELAYFDKTGIFPAMHVLAMKREVAEGAHGLARSVFDAFAKAQDIAQGNLFDSAALSTMLPWQLEALLTAKARLGKDYWPVGVQKNRAMLQTIIRYMQEDGLIKTRFEAVDLFPSEFASA